MKRAFACLVLVLALPAMTISEAGPPANLPPASFDGPQFVDARGCVYIRVGADLWVPRVDQTGAVLCGYEPSFPKPADN